MENTARITFSAVTHIGSACTVNDDRIYANGKFLHPSVADYAQISLEVNDDRCLFALSDGMEDENSGISLINDLKKFHRKASGSSKDIHVKTDEMVQYVEQASNLLHSVSLGENDFRERNTAFAGILIDDGSVAAVNMEGSRIYKLEGDDFKLMVNDFKRAERLLKMGIISDEQAELLSGRQKAVAEESASTVKKSNVESLKSGAAYLICSRGLVNSVSEDALYDILASNSNPDEAAAILVETAVKNESEDNISALVIKVEDTDGTQDDVSVGAGAVRAPYGEPIQMRYKRSSRYPARSGKMVEARRAPVDVSKVVSSTVLVILIAVVILGAFRLWTEYRNRDTLGASSQGDMSGDVTTGSTVPSSTGEGTGGTAEGGAGEDGTGEGDTTGTDTTNNPGTGEDGDGTVGPEGTTYIVKAGDMLMKISEKFYGDESKYKLIMEANNLTDPNKIAVGQELKIPPLE